IQFEGRTCDEVAVHLVDTSTISEMHGEYFNDPTTTDCISFPMDDSSETGYSVLGEIFVCPQTAIDYAAVNQLDPYREVTLYIVHRLLHLMGYDDLGDEEPLMRAAEMRHMKALEQKKLILPAK